MLKIILILSISLLCGCGKTDGFAVPFEQFSAAAVFTSDTFNRVDNANSLGYSDAGLGGTPQLWIAASGNPGTQNYKFYGPSVGGDSGYILGPSAGCTVEVTLTSMPTADSGIVTRYSNASSSITIDTDGATRYRLREIVAGVGSTIATYSTVPVAGDAIKVEVVGAAVAVYINDTIRITGSTRVTTGNGYGLFMAGGTFDNFVVKNCFVQ